MTSRRRAARVAHIVALAASTLTVGCGGERPPVSARGAQAPPAQPTATAPPLEQAPLEVVVIPRAWVEANIDVAPEALAAWTADPANRAKVPLAARHVLVRVREPSTKAQVDAARRKAETVLARAKKGEDFTKLAREASDDTTTKTSGGAFGGAAGDAAGADAAMPGAVRTAVAAIAPGDIAPDVVQTEAGFHVVRRDRPAPEAVEAAYQTAVAPARARTLADEILLRFRKDAPATAAIAEAVARVLGDAASADPDRPKSAVILPGRLANARLPADAKAVLARFAEKAKPGDVVDAPLEVGTSFVVARVAHGR